MSAKKKPDLGTAINVLKDKLKEDTRPGSYYYSWQSVLAVTMMDTLPEFRNKRELCNQAASRFLEKLIQ
jgi:hypothetical protein